MPAFRKIKLTAKLGRGKSSDGMMDELLNQYEVIKAEFDEADQSERDTIISKFNDYAPGLGDAFATGKEDFECEATCILNHEEFFIWMRDELGFGVEGLK